MNIKIKKMTLSDLENIKDILLTDFDDFWSYNVFKEELENKNSHYLVAKQNNEIISLLRKEDTYGRQSNRKNK